MSSPHKLGAWLTTLATAVTLSWMAAAVDRLYRDCEHLFFQNVKTARQEFLFGVLVILSSSLPLVFCVRAALNEKRLSWGRAWVANVGSALCISLIAAAIDRAYESLATGTIGVEAATGQEGHRWQSLAFAGAMAAGACIPLGRLVYETARPE